MCVCLGWGGCIRLVLQGTLQAGDSELLGNGKHLQVPTGAKPCATTCVHGARLCQGAHHHQLRGTIERAELSALVLEQRVTEQFIACYVGGHSTLPHSTQRPPHHASICK
jgi:hypothetical protein